MAEKKEETAPVEIEPSNTTTMTFAGKLGVIAICVLPVVLIGWSLAIAIGTGATSRGLALWFSYASLAIALLNQWLSFGRPMLHRLRHGSLDDYRFASGIPLIGSVLAAMAVVAGFGTLAASCISLASVVLDTGGLPWFLVSIWRHDIKPEKPKK